LSGWSAVAILGISLAMVATLVQLRAVLHRR
jgi:hypothetical protein